MNSTELVIDRSRTPTPGMCTGSIGTTLCTRNWSIGSMAAIAQLSHIPPSAQSSSSSSSSVTAGPAAPTPPPWRSSPSPGGPPRIIDRTVPISRPPTTPQGRRIARSDRRASPDRDRPAPRPASGPACESHRSGTAASPFPSRQGLVVREASNASSCLSRRFEPVAGLVRLWHGRCGLVKANLDAPDLGPAQVGAEPIDALQSRQGTALVRA